MKKIFFTFILVFCLVAGFAENGYNGTSWGTTKNKIQFGENIDSWQMTQNLEIITFSTTTQGKTTIKAYFFNNEKLAGISYYLPENSLKDFISKIKAEKKVLEIETELFSIQNLMESLKQSKNKKNYPTFMDGSEDSEYAFIAVLGESYLYEIASYSEEKGYKNIKKTTKKAPGTGTLYIYDYNDDTRVYITAGNVDGLAFVAYVPHVKDY